MTLDEILDANVGKQDAKLYFDLRHAITQWADARAVLYAQEMRLACWHRVCVPCAREIQSVDLPPLTPEGSS